MQIMFSGFTPTSRQRKFCEGFLFFPIKHLRKHGNFIYRQYGRHTGVKALLDTKMNVLDYNTSYAREINRCITGSAGPRAAAVLEKMEDFYPVILAAASGAPGIFQDFNDLIIHYYREVTVYHGVVLRNLQEELQAVLKPKKGDQLPEEPDFAHFSKRRKLVNEFVLQSKTIVTLLEDFFENEDNFPAGYDPRRLLGLLEDIRQMCRTQEDLYHWLKKWETDKVRRGLQTYYN